MSEETQEKIISEQEFAENANLDAVVYASEEETELKSLLVNYTGNKLDEEHVTVNMIAEVLASDFPEFAFAFAEENFVRGYQLGLDDAFRTPKEETTEITE
mgnify:FL=1